MKIRISVLRLVLHLLALEEIALRVTVMCAQLIPNVNQVTPVLSLIAHRAAVRHRIAHLLHHRQLVIILALALLNAMKSRAVRAVS